MSASKSYPLTDTLWIKKSTYPNISFYATSIDSQALLLAGTHNFQIETRNVYNSESNRRTLLIGNSNDVELYKAMQLRDTIDDTVYWYTIYGTHNITKGTSALTAGTSELTNNCIYLQYE